MRATGKITLREVAKREKVSERTAKTWASIGKRHGLDPRDVNQCEKIKGLANAQSAGASPAKGKGVKFEGPAVTGGLALQLENARRATQSAFEAYERAESGADQQSALARWEKLGVAQIALEKAAAEQERSSMMSIDAARSSMRAAFVNLRARLEAGKKSLLPDLAGENVVGMEMVFDVWLDGIFDQVNRDAERRLADG